MSPDGKLRIIISEPDGQHRERIRRCFDHATDCEVMGTACTLGETLEYVSQYRPNLLFQDVHCPGYNAATVIGQLRKKWSEMAIIALSDNSLIHIREIIEAGFNGAISKSSNDKHFLNAAGWVRDGAIGVWLLPSMVEMLFKRVAVDCGCDLTWREAQIMSLLELSNKEIAARLALTEGTVKNYISELYTKIGVENRMAALRFARQKGMVS